MAYFFFTDMILKGQTLKIFTDGDGNSLGRDFTYIDDIVQGVMKSLDHIPLREDSNDVGTSEKASLFRIYNLGNTQPVQVKEMVDILEGEVGMKALRNYTRLDNTGTHMQDVVVSGFEWCRLHGVFNAKC